MQKKGLISTTVTEVFNEVRDQIRGAWRFRWQAVALAWVLGLASWGYVLSLPDEFEASASLHIDTSDSLQPLLAGMTIRSNLLEDVGVILQSILSRPTLERIAAISGFDLGNPDEKQMESLIGRLSDKLDVDLDRDQILHISIAHENPQVAYAVVDVLIDMFVQDLMDTSASDTESAQSFLMTKLAEYEGQLIEAESNLADFKKRNIGQMPGERGGYYARLQGEMLTLTDIESQLRLARQRKDVLERQLVGEAPVLGLMPSSQSSGVFTSPQIEMLEAQLTDLRLSYTDAHPDVVRIRELIASLQQELAEDPLSGPVSRTSDVDSNPVFQQMKIAYNQAELEYSQLVTRREDQARLVENLRTKIDTIPEIEAELTRLTRNYNVYRKQHDELLMRLETAKLSEAADNNRRGLKFRVIDPPKVNSWPAGPPRSLLVTAAFIFAILVGVGLALLRSVMTPVFFSSYKLESTFDIPVIGSIRYWESPREHAKSRAGIAIFSAAALSFFGCYLLIVIFNYESAKLVDRFVQLMG